MLFGSGFVMPAGINIAPSRAKELLRRLDRRRLQLGLSWRKFSRLCGVSIRSIDTLKADRTIGQACVRRICNSFGWSPDYFIFSQGTASSLEPERLRREAAHPRLDPVRRREILIAAAGTIRARMADVPGITVEDILTANDTVQLTARRAAGSATPRMVELVITGRSLTYTLFSYASMGANFSFSGAGILSEEGVSFCAEYLSIPGTEDGQGRASTHAMNHHVNSHRHIDRYHHGS
jgi:hypothetical protein